MSFSKFVSADKNVSLRGSLSIFSILSFFVLVYKRSATVSKNENHSSILRLDNSITSYLSHTKKSLRKLMEPPKNGQISWCREKNWSVHQNLLTRREKYLFSLTMRRKILKWCGRFVGWCGRKVCHFRMTEVGRSISYGPVTKYLPFGSMTKKCQTYFPFSHLTWLR